MSAPRVVVDARPLDIDFLRTQGIGRYAHSLLPPLAQVASERGGELVLLRGAAAATPVYEGGRHRAAERRVRRPPVPDRIADLPEQVLLPLDVRRARGHVLHSLSIYRAAPTRGIPAVVSVLDVIPLMFPDLYLRTGLMHRLLYRAARRATRLITISHAARRDIVSHLGVPSDRIDVTHLAADPHFQPRPDPDVPRRHGIAGPYLLYVGGLANTDPRKNVESLIDAFSEWSISESREETLVLSGRLGLGGRPLEERARARGARILFTDFVPDRDLPALMSCARCLVTASRYEGFGLPAIEAVACGTPVVAFDAGAIPEAAGPGALLARDGDSGQLMSLAGRVCDDPELRHRLGADGRRHAAEFSWRRTAELTWDTYERAAS